MPEFSHLDESGRAKMVDVSDKAISSRVAVASCRVEMNAETLEKIKQGDLTKGDVLSTARLAGIMATKKTPELIPLCHTLALSTVTVDFDFVDQRSIQVTCSAKTVDRTGVEMEALTGAAVSGLTIYDMCKSIDRTMKVTDLQLEKKSGGASGDFVRKGDEH